VAGHPGIRDCTQVHPAGGIALAGLAPAPSRALSRTRHSLDWRSIYVKRLGLSARACYTSRRKPPNHSIRTGPIPIPRPPARRPSMRHYPLCILIILAGLAGCQHLPKSAAPEGDVPPGAPAPGEVLADLTAPDRTGTNFSSSGTIRMRLPGQAATQRFDRSHVRYHRPGRYFARAFTVGQSVNIDADGPVFLLDVPQEQTFYYGREGDRFEDVALDIAPSLIFREFFLVDALRGVEEESL